MSSSDPRFFLRGKIPYLALIAAVLIADQVSKWLITRSLPLYHQKVMIPGFCRLFHVQNHGAVWGFMSNHTSGIVPKIITMVSLAAMLLVVYFFLKLPSQCRLEILSFSFVLAGALGNNFDRLRLGYVVDFIDIYFKNLRWPTFNVADSFISIGVVLLAICIWRGKCSQF